MVIFLVAILVVIGAAPVVEATDRWVDATTSGCSTPSDTDYNPSTESCGSGSELVYNTIAAAGAAAAAGDNIYVMDGTYSAGIVNNIPAGTSNSVRTNIQAFNRRQVTLNPSSTQPVLLTNRSYITIQGFVLDAVNGTAHVVKIEGASHHVWLIDNEIENSTTGQGVLVQFLTAGRPAFGILRGNDIHHNGNAGNKDHGLYLNGGDDWLIERNDFHHNAKFGAQLYTNPKRTIVRYNKFRDNCNIDTSGTQLVVSHQDHLIERNWIYKNSGNCTSGIYVGLQTPARSKLRHNTVTCATGTCSNGISVDAATDTVLQNNLVIGFTTAVNIINGSTGTVNTDTLSTGTAASHFKDRANGDLSLVSGSTAIDNGTDIGLAYAGTAPDHGAAESFAPVSGSLDIDHADVTFSVIHPPIAPASTTGWSVSCLSGVCPSPLTVANVQLLSGSDTAVRVEIDGFPSNTCVAGYQIGLTFNASTGTIQDGLSIGNSLNTSGNQYGFSFTDFPITNNCSGSGPPAPPGSPYASYPLDGNANDDSGNARHGTASGGVTYTTGLHGQAAVFGTGEGDTISLAGVNAINPTTTSLTVALGFYVDAADLGQTRNLAGAIAGTDQRFYIRRRSDNTLAMGIQTLAAPATDLTITAGWHHACLTANEATNIATLYLDGIAGAVTNASVFTYTSYVIQSEWTLGGPTDFPLSQSGGMRIDEAKVYQSVVSCTDLATAFLAPGVVADTFSQPAIRFQSVFVDGSGNPINLGTAINQAQDVVEGGAVAVNIQVDCDDCAATSFKFETRKNGTGDWSQVPDVESALGPYMWGGSVPLGLNNGALSTRLTGSCTVINGVTITTASQIPVVTLPVTGCTINRYLVKFGASATAPNYYEFRLVDQNGVAFTGSYSLARVNMIAKQANGSN